MSTSRTPFFSLLLCAASALIITGCNGGIESEAKYPSGKQRGSESNDIYGERETIFGSGGILGSSKRADKEEGVGITVNSFLWRASLDTVSFMPLASADPFGGVILTDWYTTEDNANERFKLNVFILTRQLRSDGIQVRVFKQVREKDTWRDVKPAPETARQLEDTILTRARQLRVTQLAD